MSAAKPVLQTITIKLSSAPLEQQIQASVLGGLAIHEDQNTPGWMITHVRSGYGMVRSYNRNRAFSLRRALLTLPLDYTELDKDEVLAHAQEIKATVADWFRANGGIAI